MRALPRLLVAVAALLPGLAPAQQVSIEPSAAQRCLQLAPRAEPGPEYPFEQLKRDRGGSVVVLLTFSHPDRRPKVEVVEHEGDGAFVDAVEAHVARLRVPCLRRDEGPATLRQAYRFKPDEHRVVSVDSDPAAARQQRLAACLMHVSGVLQPDYPHFALRDHVQGRVLARLRFDAADQPPQVEVLHRTRARPLGTDIRRFAQGYRLPCHEGGPVRLSILYKFFIDGGGGYGFRALALPQFVAGIKNIRLQRVAFDFSAMACPFDVTLTYFQPLAPNDVSTPGDDARRSPFLQWLRDAELALNDGALDAVFGDTVTFTVPCGKIDLQPEERS